MLIGRHQVSLLGYCGTRARHRGSCRASWCMATVLVERSNYKLCIASAGRPFADPPTLLLKSYHGQLVCSPKSQMAVHFVISPAVSALTFLLPCVLLPPTCCLQVLTVMMRRLSLTAPASGAVSHASGLTGQTSAMLLLLAAMSMRRLVVWVLWLRSWVWLTGVVPALLHSCRCC